VTQTDELALAFVVFGISLQVCASSHTGSAIASPNAGMVSAISHPPIVTVQPSIASPFILYPMLFSSLATAPVLVATRANDAANGSGGITARECNPPMFRTLHPVSMLQMPAVLHSSSILTALQPVTMVTSGDLTSHIAT
jgi:hypothetical protein